MQIHRFSKFSFGALASVALVVGAAVVFAADNEAASSGNASKEASLKTATLVYVGTYTNTPAKSKGIYLFKLQTQNLEVSQNILLVPLGVAAETPSPSFLQLDPKRHLLFAVNETNSFEGKPTGSVSSFSIDPGTGKLTQLSQRSSLGAGPCHLALDKAGKHVLVANYDSGSVAVLPVDANGHLGEPTDFIQHQGKSVNPERQEAAHAHCITFDPTNQFVFVCDLGLDKVMCYRYDAEHGKLSHNDPAFTVLKPGAGPRHMVFRPDGKFAYVINELDSTITAFAYNPKTGALAEVQTVSTLPPYWEGKNTTAEIDVHPSGKWLYASNRGHNSVVLFGIDSATGKLEYVEEQGTGGKTPRNFGIEPSAKHLAIANQDSNTVLVCRIDSGNGRLKPSGVFADAPAPVCVKFLPPAAEK